MSINDETLKKLATLSKLDISDDQIIPLKKDIDSILSMIAQIEEINTDEVKPLSHPLEINQRLRDDAAELNNIKKDIQKLSSNIENDLYIVPKVID